MSEINRPKEIVSDDEKGYIAPELYEYFDYESELDEEEILEFDHDEAQIVLNYGNYIDMDQINADLRGGAMDLSTYKPAQVIRVLNKFVRTLPSGQVVIDYELEIEEVVSATSYEVRVMQT